MTRWRIVLLGAWLVTLGAACLAPSPTSPAAPAVPSPATARDRLRAIYTSQAAVHAPVWLAQDGGHFLANGLEVELTFVSGTTTAAQALLAGEAQFAAQPGSAAVATALMGGDTLLVATTHGTFVFVLAAVPEVTAVADLAGLALGVSRFGTSARFAARWALQRAGLELGTDVGLVLLGSYAETLAALEAGQVQAALVSDLAGVDLRRRGYPWLLDLGALDVEYSHHGLTVTRTFLGERPDQARRFVRAVVQAMGQFVQDPAVAKRVLGRYTREHDPEVLDAVWQMHATRHLRRAPYTTPAAVQLLLEELAPRYSRALTADPDEFYDNTLVRELDESGFLASVY